MNKAINPIFFLLLLAFVFSIATINPLTAEAVYDGDGFGEKPICGELPSCIGDSWVEIEYRCSSQDCEADILQRGRTCGYDCSWPQDCECTESGWDCGECQCDSTDCTDWSDAESIESCGYWQKCINGSDWTAQAPSCVCAGECLNKPENPRLLDGEDEGVAPDDVALPVKLDWDDVEHAQSYKFQINGEEQIERISQQGYVETSEALPESCSFQSNFENLWKTIPCCAADGTNCKAWNDVDNWVCNANLSPELVSPYDSDWQGPEKAENITLPLSLDWCEVEEAESYRFLVYLVDNGQKTCHPWLVTTKECESWLLKKDWREEGQEEKILYSDFLDEEMTFFTKDTTYLWKVSLCLDSYGVDCKDYSQEWTFITGETPLSASLLAAPQNDPQGIIPVGLPISLDWRNEPGANSYRYEISPVNGGQTISGKNTSSQTPYINFPQLSLNTSYQWKVKVCWDYEAEQCEQDFSDTWYFKTTGRAPVPASPSSGAIDASIPVNFDWHNVPGAKSYVLKVQGKGLNLEKSVDESIVSLDYPDLKMLTNYSWQVKTCAWKNGETCGIYSLSQSFTTFKIPAPSNPSPSDKGNFSTDQTYISWQEVVGAKAYQYNIKYLSLSPEEKDSTCPPLVGKEINNLTKTQSSNAFISLKCLGNYQWQVRSCLDKDCNETGNWSNLWSFSFVQSSEGARQKGLVPCGRNADNPNTPWWNERDPCQIKHLLLLIKIIIDFLLFRLAPIIVVLLTIATGAMFYFSISTAGPSPIAKAKSLWKSVGIGLFIAFFAWTIVNVILKIVGYQISVFGNWYQF